MNLQEIFHVNIFSHGLLLVLMNLVENKTGMASCESQYAPLSNSTEEVECQNLQIDQLLIL